MTNTLTEPYIGIACWRSHRSACKWRGCHIIRQKELACKEDLRYLCITAQVYCVGRAQRLHCTGGRRLSNNRATFIHIVYTVKKAAVSCRNIWCIHEFWLASYVFICICLYTTKLLFVVQCIALRYSTFSRSWISDCSWLWLRAGSHMRSYMITIVYSNNMVGAHC